MWCKIWIESNYTWAFTVIPLSLSTCNLSRTCLFLSSFWIVPWKSKYCQKYKKFTHFKIKVKNSEINCILPVNSKSLSASVLFPWSTCAMIQKFRINSPTYSSSDNIDLCETEKKFLFWLINLQSDVSCIPYNWPLNQKLKFYSK